MQTFVRATVAAFVLAAGVVQAEDPAPVQPAQPAQPAPAQPKIPSINVNGEKIPASMLEVLYKRTLINYERMAKKPPAPGILDRLVDQAQKQAVQQVVIRQYVETNKIAGTPEGIDEEINTAKGQIEAAGINFDQFLKERDQTLEQFRADLAPLAALTQSIANSQDKDALKASFERDKAKIPVRRASHILFMHNKSPNTTQKVRTPEEAKKMAEDALASIRGGKDFAAVAREVSDCPSKAQGGDLNWFLASMMVKPFSDATFALEKVGDVTPVVETEFGYHVIKLTGLRTPEEAFKVFVRQKTESKVAELVGKLIREAKVERLAE